MICGKFLTNFAVMMSAKHKVSSSCRPTPPPYVVKIDDYVS